MTTFKKHNSAILLIILAFYVSYCVCEVTEKPVIGIVSTPSDFRNLYDPQEYSYIKGSYAEYIESAGGIPIAIHWDLPERDLIKVLDSVNGILFTGGDADMWEFDRHKNDIVFTNFTQRASFIVAYAIHLNDKGIHFPVYGICQGFEVITMSLAGKPHIIDHFKHPVQHDSVEILETSSRMYSTLQDHMVASMKEQQSMFYNHRYGFNMSLLSDNSDLDELFIITAKGKDDHGKEFIAGLEAKEYPIFIVQYHPERTLSEWLNKEHFSHPDEVGMAALSQAAFFVSEARKNKQKFLSNEALEYFLLSNHEAEYFNITWPRVYFYDKKSDGIEIDLETLLELSDMDSLTCNELDYNCVTEL
jgi:gamma-glutamyl hydrolase